MWRSSKGKTPNLLFSASRQEMMSGNFLGSRTSAYVVVALEGKSCKIMNVLPSSSYFLAFVSEHTYVVWHGISLCSVPVSCPGYVLSQDSAHPKLAGVGGNVGNTAWMLWELSSSQNTVFSVASQLLLEGLLRGEWALPQPDPMLENCERLCL